MNTIDHPPLNKTEINERYLCKICEKIFRNVHQAECGCRYCFECLEKQLPNEICVVCGENIPADVKVPDRAFQKEINNMIVKCVECDWKGKFIDYKDHFKKHEKIKCQYCGTTFLNEDLLRTHLNEILGDCEKQPIQCTFSDIGCRKHDYDRKTIVEHSKNEVNNHLQLVYNNFNPRITKLESHYQSLIISRQENIGSKTASNIQIGQSFNEEMTGDLSLKLKPKSHRESELSTKKVKSEDSDINSKMSMLEYNLKIVGDDLNKYVLNTEKLNKELEESKTSEKKLREEVENLQKSLTFAQTTIISLEERLVAQEKASYNGTLVWKITNVRDKIQEAKSGRQTSIYSPPFYTHQNGFKMCGRIYLNGDGMGRNTHVSLFFVIMRGEYDALLRWPFRQKVTFMLMDQSTNESRENIIDAFRPDPNSNSFKRPTSDMNIASGIPLFCPLSKLNSTDHEYVKDDCMFIKIIVDSRDLIDI